MGKNYEIIEHTADIGLNIFGKTKQELFQNAARGMFFLITGSFICPEQKNRQYWTVECEASNIDDLLVSWLSELLYIHHTDFVFFDDFIINSLTRQLIQAEVWGGKMKDSSCEIEKEIKAVTYHRLRVFKNDQGLWEANIIFDI